jgi:hypothetical protein
MVKLPPVLINALHKKPAPIERDTVLTDRACPGVGVISQDRIAPRHGGDPQDAGKGAAAGDR